MATNLTVRIVHGALDETPLRGGSIILRGVVAPESLCALHADEYQREVLMGKKQNKMIAAMQQGDAIPDIELGMRGGNFYQPKKDGKIVDDEFILKDPVYIVDGLQRVNAAIVVRDTRTPVRIGATIHFDTTREWERERFYTLNTQRTPVSPNVHLRNLREEHPSVLALYGLTHDNQFVLGNRVCWSQALRKNDLITAWTMARTTGMLHSWLMPGLREASVSKHATNMDELIKKISITTLKRNITTFFDTMDQAWGVRRIQYRESVPQLKSVFLKVFAAVLNDHTNFWSGKRGDELTILADTRRKLAQLSMADPTLANLAGSSGKASQVLYMLIRDHINSSRRTNRLKPRDPDGLSSLVLDEDPPIADAA